MNPKQNQPLTKSFPVFDCDAHITESPDQWNYLSEKELDEVRPWYYPEGNNLMVNGIIGTQAIWIRGRKGYEWGGVPQPHCRTFSGAKSIWRSLTSP